MDLRSHLLAEFARRRARNSRYSLRALAHAFGLSHSTLSRLFRSERRLTPSTRRRIVARLRLDARQAERALVAETSSALLACIPHPRFRPDSRWLAVMTGRPLDEVNIALHALLHDRRLTLTHTSWQMETHS